LALFCQSDRAAADKRKRFRDHAGTHVIRHRVILGQCFVFSRDSVSRAQRGLLLLSITSTFPSPLSRAQRGIFLVRKTLSRFFLSVPKTLSHQENTIPLSSSTSGLTSASVTSSWWIRQSAGWRVTPHALYCQSRLPSCRLKV
jgi:hypothetical protein